MAPFVQTADPVGGLIVFAVSLFVGGAAIHLGVTYVTYRDEPGSFTFEHAVFTALLGAIGWALLSWIPIVGSLLALLGWVAVIKFRYPGGWADAAITGAAAWAGAVVVLAVLELLGLGSVSALGVPGA